MIKKALSLATALTLAMMVSCPTVNAGPNKEIIVSAAISLKKPFEEIGKVFEDKNKGVKVLFNFGGSGSLARQIEAGAPVDVFASASPKDLDDIAIKGLIESDSRVNFAGNSVVLIKPVKAAARTESFKDRQGNGVNLVALGNPAQAPAGSY